MNRKGMIASATLGALIVAFAAGNGLFASRSDDDALFREMRTSLQLPGDRVSLRPLARDASRMCVVAPYVRRDRLVEELGAEVLAFDIEDIAGQDGLWGIALRGPAGTRVVKGSRADGDISTGSIRCWNDPQRLEIVLVSGARDYSSWRIVEFRG